MLTNRFCTVITSWLNAPKRSRVGVGRDLPRHVERVGFASESTCKTFIPANLNNTLFYGIPF